MNANEKFEALKGKTLINVENKDNEEIIFSTTSGETYKLFHSQDCCEYVVVEDICGELDDLIGVPLVEAEEVTSNENPSDAREDLVEGQDSYTWTFYKLRTSKGVVTIRWYGESNGYYSEEVDFVRVD